MGAAACIAEGRDMDCGAGVQREGELKQFALPHDVTHEARPPKRTKPAEYGGIRGRGKYAPHVLEQALRDIASQFHQKRLQAGASLTVFIIREDLKDGGGNTLLRRNGKGIHAGQWAGQWGGQ